MEALLQDDKSGCARGGGLEPGGQRQLATWRLLRQPGCGDQAGLKGNSKPREKKTIGPVA